MSDLPEIFLKHLASVDGFDRDALRLAHESSRQVHSIRINQDKLNDQSNLIFSELIKEDVPWCHYGKYLSERPSFILDPVWHGGGYYVQEASSMFLWHILNQINLTDGPSVRILDLCAAPAGKTTILATKYKEALIVSNETIKNRVPVLLENCNRWGSENIVVTSNDAADFSRIDGYFDIILADVPCSGSGLFRKQPDAIGLWSENSVMLCCQRQERILSDALPALKIGGILVYSTCSYSREENENIVDWLIKDHQLEPVRIGTENEWNIVETKSEKEGWGYRFFPDKLKGEGFFIAVLKKTAGATFQKLNSKKQVKTIARPDGLSPWLKDEKPLYFLQQNEKILAIPQSIKNELTFLQQNLYLKKAGIEAGTSKGREFIPEHALALSRLLREDVPALELDLPNAINYLKKKEISFANPVKGWRLVRFNGINIGWAKGLDTRINNYYPTSWRILKD